MTEMTEIPTPLHPYAKHPMSDGDGVLFLDEAVCFEVKGLADHWDRQMCESLVHILSESGCTTVQPAVARLEAELRPGDHVLWAELREGLLETPVTLLPLVNLPAR